MASPVPKHVAAALGLVPTVVEGVRRLPGKAVQLPVIAVGSALAGVDAARREYDELAERGERLVARLRGTSLDETADPVDRSPADSQPESASNPAGPTRVDSAAAPAVIAQVEQIASRLAAPVIDDHADLPLPDYDHMTLGSLRGRLRSLDTGQLVQLRDYEKSRADRLPVITMLDNRIAKLASGASLPTGAPVAAEPVAPNKPPKRLDAPATVTANAGPPRTKVRST